MERTHFSHLLFVPHGRDEDERGADCGFKHAQQESTGRERGVGVTWRSISDHCAPETDHSSEIFRERESLHHERVGHLEYQESQVE